MTQLMRNDLVPLYRKAVKSKADSSHAGLLMQRGLLNWSSEDKEKKDKSELIKNISNVKPSPIYRLALKRWIHKTYSNDESSTFASLAAKVEGRLMTGLPLGGALETGVTTHHSYGMPLLAGSSIKGAVRNYAEFLYCEKDEDGKPKFDGEKDNRKLVIPDRYHKTIEALFGTDEDAETQDAGYIVWHDALWLPSIDNRGNFFEQDNVKPFMEDIITVHHQEYYSNGKNPASGMESPIPNQQLSVQGMFYFVLEGAPQWVAYAKKLLQEAIQFNGLGAKTSSGYGYFVLDETLDEKLKSIVSGQEKSVAMSQKSDDLYHEARITLQYMDDEKQLAEIFGKNINNFFNKCGLNKSDLEHCRGVTAVALEFHKDTIESWKGADRKSNPGKSYRFLSKFF